MPDLSQVPGRDLNQRRVTTNRDNILPARRITETDDVRVLADMRNAYRGDVQAQELKRALGMVNDTVSVVVDLKQKQHAVAEKENAQQGVADAALGKVDEEKLKASEAYRITIALSKARKQRDEIDAAMPGKVEGFLNDHPEADLDDVNAFIEAEYKPALLDPQGKPIDYGDPAANRELYSGLAELRPRLLQGAAKQITTQVQERVLTGLGDELEASAMKSGTVDFESFMGRVPPGMDRGKAKASLLESAAIAAERTGNADLLFKLADSRRPDGTPSLNPSEERDVRAAGYRVAEKAEREHREKLEERSALTFATVTDRVLGGGKPFTLAEGRDLVARGELRPQDLTSLLGVNEKREDDLYEDEVRARQTISWNQSQADRARARAADGETATPTFSNIRRAIASRDVTVFTARRLIDDAYRTGALGTGSTSISRRQALIADLDKLGDANRDAVKTSGAQVWEQVLITDLKNYSAHNIGKPGQPSAQEWQYRENEIFITFYDGLYKGASPERAYRDALAAVDTPAWLIDKSAKATAQKAKAKGLASDADIPMK